MDQLLAMRVFSRVVELGGFNLAARQLGISPAAATRNISMLEAYLNARLLNRTTRSISLTDQGRAYLDGCREVIQKLEEMKSALAHGSSDLKGTLRIAAPMPFATAELGKLLAYYRALHPGVDFHITIFDTNVDMMDGGFDVCFSDDRQPAATALISRRLTGFKEVLVASPGYLARHGAPATPSALKGHGLLTVSDGYSRNWELTDGLSVFRIHAGSALTATSHEMIRTAALSHMGIALLPLNCIQVDIEHGALIPILQDFEVKGGFHSISILYAGRNYPLSKVRNFVDFVVEQYRKVDEPTVHGNIKQVTGPSSTESEQLILPRKTQ
ncbi:MAG: LysR family transcriptional regulator [Paraburkholderia sp.]|uniref:LysR family transcriptional regulator n=1 Tax=Paraburkholderia sp. TaxID=1926495 RepID=UPI0039792E05